MGSCSPSKDGPRHLMFHTRTHTHHHLLTILPCPPADGHVPLPSSCGLCFRESAWLWGGQGWGGH